MNSVIGHSPGIYQIRCLVNDKIYVGSAVNLSKRWAYHKFKMRLNKSACRILQKAWNKYGGENLVFEVIERIEDVNTLLEREQFHLDTLKPQYNICKIAGSQLGIKRSPESKLRYSASKSGKNSPSYGKGKRVIQFDLQGNQIREWISVYEPYRELKFTPSHIYECCKGRRKTAYKFKWQYKND